MEEELSYEQKTALLKSDANPHTLLYAIRREDVQGEAVDRLGRLLTDDELAQAADMLEWGIGENMMPLYHTVFAEINNAGEG